MRRVVCAALCDLETGAILLGVRHFDEFMRSTIAYDTSEIDWTLAEQGFVDQQGKFMNRQESHDVASAANQIIRRVGGDTGKLFSENLY